MKKKQGQGEVLMLRRTNVAIHSAISCSPPVSTVDGRKPARPSVLVHVGISNTGSTCICPTMLSSSLRGSQKVRKSKP